MLYQRACVRRRMVWRLLAGIFIASILPVGGATSEPAYPVRPITLIVPLEASEP